MMSLTFGLFSQVSASGPHGPLVFLFNQHVRHKIILKIKRYLSAYNEYYEVSVEGPYINMKLRIGNRESGTGNWFLVPYLSKRL